MLLPASPKYKSQHKLSCSHDVINHTYKAEVCTDLSGEGHINVNSLAVEQFIAGLQSSHLNLRGKSVPIIYQAAENVLPQVVLQFLQHPLDATSHCISSNLALQHSYYISIKLVHMAKYAQYCMLTFCIEHSIAGEYQAKKQTWLLKAYYHAVRQVYAVGWEAC